MAATSDDEGAYERRFWEEQVSRPVVFAFLALLLISNTAFLPAVHAAPPTVTPSPGYDARLQEQRKMTSTSTTLTRTNPPVMPRHYARRMHRH
jgi:hypothetical protein